jgi:hypothetical protein
VAPIVAEMAYPIPFLVYLGAVVISVGAAMMLEELGDEDRDKPDLTQKQEQISESLIDNKTK